MMTAASPTIILPLRPSKFVIRASSLLATALYTL
jgi:hypothetical protein